MGAGDWKAPALYFLENDCPLIYLFILFLQLTFVVNGHFIVIVRFKTTE